MKVGRDHRETQLNRNQEEMDEELFQNYHHHFHSHDNHHRHHLYRLVLHSISIYRKNKIIDEKHNQNIIFHHI